MPKQRPGLGSAEDKTAASEAHIISRATIMAALIGALGGIAAGVGGAVVTKLGQTPSATAAAPAPAPKIEIVSPTDELDRCGTLTGTAFLPPKTTLWILNRPVGLSTYFVHGSVKLDDPSATADHPSRWEYPGVWGNPQQVGAKFEIFAVALPDAVSEYLESATITGGDANPLFDIHQGKTPVGLAGTKPPPGADMAHAAVIRPKVISSGQSC